MKLLAFELATEGCSVALWNDGEIRERFEIAPRRSAELALPWAQQLLAESGIAKTQLDAIAVGRGPGAFTGVRLAIAIGQGIALALDRPIVPVSTLAALAMQADVDAQVLAAIDARMGEVYFGAFLRSDDDAAPLWNAHLSLTEGVLPPGQIVWDGAPKDLVGVGTGFAAADGLLQRRLSDELRTCDPAALPHAADVARLGAAAFARGDAVAADAIQPAYLRNNVALTIQQQQALREAR